MSCLLQCIVASLARDGPQLDCPVLNITGALSPQLAATLDLNTRLQPARSTWLKVLDTRDTSRSPFQTVQVCFSRS